MRILITGGAGFIGSHLAEFYQGRAKVRVLDNLCTGHRHNLEGLEVEFMEGDVTDDTAVGRAVADCDLVVHLAAMVSVPLSMEQPRECVRINTLGTLALCEAAADAGVKKLVLASSAAVYGDDPVLPKEECLVPAPTSPYAVSKLDGEYYLEIFRREGRLSTAALRFFNVFGPRQDPHSPYAAAFPAFVERALGNEPITVHGDGLQTRDFIFVKDIVSALAYVGENPVEGVFNCGYGEAIAILDLARSIIAELGSTSSVVHGPNRPGDVKHSRASVEKLKAAGWRPPHGFVNGLEETLREWPRPRHHA